MDMLCFVDFEKMCSLAWWQASAHGLVVPDLVAGVVCVVLVNVWMCTQA